MSILDGVITGCVNQFHSLIAGVLVVCGGVRFFNVVVVSRFKGTDIMRFVQI